MSEFSPYEHMRSSDPYKALLGTDDDDWDGIVKHGVRFLKEQGESGDSEKAEEVRGILNRTRTDIQKSAAGDAAGKAELIEKIEGALGK
jgi:hypothetical protein